MTRRQAVLASAAAGLATAAPADSPKNSIYYLRYYYMRSGPQVDRTTAWLRDTWLPASQRHKMGPVGFFSPVYGGRGPYILSLAAFPSFAAIQTLHDNLAADKDYQKGWDAYNDLENPGYIRMDSTMLYAFDKFPTLDPPPNDGKRPARTFELRTYESVNEKASARKIKMFEDGEAAVFRRVGMNTVFFGAGIVGTNLPSLTYMLSYEDMAAREKLWRDFGADPEWRKLRAQPGLSDAEIVSNITSTILRPLPFSPIR